MGTKILVVSDSDPWNPEGGGIETHLSEVLPRLNDDFDVILLTDSVSKNPTNVEVVEFNNLRVRFLDTISYVFMISLKSLMISRKRKVDKIWCMNVFPTGLAGMAVSKLTKTDFFLSIHNILEDTRGGVFRPFINSIVVSSAKKVHVVGEQILEQVTELNEAVENIPNGIDEEKFSPGLNESLETDNEGYELNLVCVSHYRPPQKRQDILVEAVEELDNVKLTLVGSDTEKLESEEQNIEVKGLVDEERIPKILNQADLFVMPSSYEGHPIAVIEAMSTGLPILGTDIPALESLVDEKNGAKTSLDKHSLKKSIKDAKEWEIKKKGKISRKRALEYSWDNIYPKIKNFLGGKN